jgi:hypothetical protein
MIYKSITENLMPQEEFEALRNLIVGDETKHDPHSNIPLYLRKYSVTPEYQVPSDKLEICNIAGKLYDLKKGKPSTLLASTLFDKGQVVSPSFLEVGAPLMPYMPKGIVLQRIRLVVLLDNPKGSHSGWHIDNSDPIDSNIIDNSMTAIFYLTNNAGGTLLEDGTFIQSKENRLVEFSGSIYHTGIADISPGYARALLNFNYTKRL